MQIERGDWLKTNPRDKKQGSDWRRRPEVQDNWLQQEDGI
jgi:hypothetical protein